MPVSVGKVLGRGVFVVDGALYDAQDERATKVMDLAARDASARRAQLAERGARLCRDQAFREGPARHRRRDRQSFPGLAHRMEDVGRIGKVRFVNDSKATNADAAARALACYPDIFWIAGGKPKEGGIDSLAPYFPRIRKAYLIGEAAHAILAARSDGKVVYRRVAARWSKAVRPPPPMRRVRQAARLWCCCRPLALLSTSSRISSSAAMPSAPLVAQTARIPCGRRHELRAPTAAALPAGGGRSTAWRCCSMLALIAIGLMLAFAASPAATGGPLTAGDFRYAASSRSCLHGIAAVDSWRRLAAVAAPGQDRGRCASSPWR